MTTTLPTTRFTPEYHPEVGAHTLDLKRDLEHPRVDQSTGITLYTFLNCVGAPTLRHAIEYTKGGVAYICLESYNGRKWVTLRSTSFHGSD